MISDDLTRLESRAYIRQTYPNIPDVLVDKYFNMDSLNVGTYVWLYPELVDEFYTALQILVPGVIRHRVWWYSPFTKPKREFAAGARIDLPLFNLMFMDQQELEL